MRECPISNRLIPSSDNMPAIKLTDRFGLDVDAQPAPTSALLKYFKPPRPPHLDRFGLDVDAQPAPTSALLKYFKPPPSLRLDSFDLSKAGGMTLDQPAIQSL